MCGRGGLEQGPNWSARERYWEGEGVQDKKRGSPGRIGGLSTFHTNYSKGSAQLFTDFKAESALGLYRRRLCTTILNMPSTGAGHAAR